MIPQIQFYMSFSVKLQQIFIKENVEVIIQIFIHPFCYAFFNCKVYLRNFLLFACLPIIMILTKSSRVTSNMPYKKSSFSVEKNIFFCNTDNFC